MKPDLGLSKKDGNMYARETELIGKCETFSSTYREMFHGKTRTIVDRKVICKRVRLVALCQELC